MIAPHEPSGNSSLISWCRKILRYVLSLEIKPGPGYTVSRGPSGTILYIAPPGGAGATVSKYMLKEHKGDYLVCHTWDDTTQQEGTEDVFIAKPPELRYSVKKETVDTVLLTYTTYDEGLQTRLASDGSSTETQIIVPRYRTEATPPDDLKTIIRAITVSGGTGAKDENGKDITLEDMNFAGRAWAAIRT